MSKDKIDISNQPMIVELEVKIDRDRQTLIQLGKEIADIGGDIVNRSGITETDLDVLTGLVKDVSRLHGEIDLARRVRQELKRK